MTNPLRDLATWLVSFDNPDRANDRRALTLDDVIATARQALTDAKPTPPVEARPDPNVDHAALAAATRAQLHAAQERERQDRAALDTHYANQQEKP